VLDIILFGIKIMKLVRIQDIQHLFAEMEIKTFFRELVTILREDFSQWKDFQKSSRYAAYVKNGVMELMPICSCLLYTSDAADDM
jgi:hypothetical protein